MSNAMGLPGGPAFPISIPGYGDNGASGMSLRDWFAGMALASVYGHALSARLMAPDSVARGAYDVADSMLRVREAADPEKESS